LCEKRKAGSLHDWWLVALLVVGGENKPRIGITPTTTACALPRALHACTQLSVLHTHTREPASYFMFHVSLFRTKLASGMHVSQSVSQSANVSQARRAESRQTAKEAPHHKLPKRTGTITPNCNLNQPNHSQLDDQLQQTTHKAPLCTAYK
jgi:hypothetical protein